MSFFYIPNITPEIFLVSIYLGSVVFVGGQILWVYALHNNQKEEIALLSFLTPIIAVGFLGTAGFEVNHYNILGLVLVVSAAVMINKSKKEQSLIDFDVQAEKMSEIIADVIYSLPDDDVYVGEDAMTYFVLSKEYAVIQSDEYLEKIIIALYLLYKFKAWELDKDPYHEQLFENVFLIEKIFELKKYMPRYRGALDEEFRSGYTNFIAGRGSQLISMAM